MSHFPRCELRIIAVLCKPWEGVWMMQKPVCESPSRSVTNQISWYDIPFVVNVWHASSPLVLTTALQGRCDHDPHVTKLGEWGLGQITWQRSGSEERAELDVNPQLLKCRVSAFYHYALFCPPSTAGKLQTSPGYSIGRSFRVRLEKGSGENKTTLSPKLHKAVIYRWLKFAKEIIVV